MSKIFELVRVYYVVIGDSVLGYCSTVEEAEEWVSDLKAGIFKRDADHIEIVEDWVEDYFYGDF